MKNLAPYPKFRAFNSLGAPLAGGKLYTYEQGTSTPKAAYSDNDLTVPHTNPIILDANGEEDVFLDGFYKFVLHDADDVLILTADEVSTYADADAAYIAQAVIDVDADAAQVAADRVQTGLDVIATNADVVSTNADVVSTNADVVTTNANAATTTQDAIDTAADAAATAADRVAVESIYDTYDDRELGVKASDPSLDNDGNALVVGAQYFNSTEDKKKVYTSTGWDYYAAIESTDEIKPITASVDSSELTITLNPTLLDFRSSTLGSGTVNSRDITSPISLVISSGSTLGTEDGVESRIAVLAIDNSGTVELAAVNLHGGNNLDETTLITTTAEGGSGAADSASVIYSTTARTSVPFRVVGFVESTQATAGTWATSPSTIQGKSGNLAIGPINAPNTVKAWVNFNGTGTVAIRDSFNVSSITDNGTGDYTVNFTNPMRDTNYAPVVSGRIVSGASASYIGIKPSGVFTTSAFQIQSTANGAAADTDIVTAIVSAY